MFTSNKNISKNLFTNYYCINSVVKTLSSGLGKKSVTNDDVRYGRTRPLTRYLLLLVGCEIPCVSGAVLRIVSDTVTTTL